MAAPIDIKQNSHINHSSSYSTPVQRNQEQQQQQLLIPAQNQNQSRFASSEMGAFSTLSSPKPWLHHGGSNPKFQNQSAPSAHFRPPLPRKLRPFTCFALDSSRDNAPPLVVVGSANADIYVEIDRLPKEGETVSAKTGQTLAGGKGANQAVCGGKLAYPTYFVGQVGRDAHGKLITEALQGGGVVLDRLTAVAGAPTVLKFLMM